VLKYTEEEEGEDVGVMVGVIDTQGLPERLGLTLALALTLALTLKDTEEEGEDVGVMVGVIYTQGLPERLTLALALALGLTLVLCGDPMNAENPNRIAALSNRILHIGTNKFDYETNRNQI
jgi:hypothetical protein